MLAVLAAISYHPLVHVKIGPLSISPHGVGIALGFAVIPIVFSISEDALTSVPRSYTHAALALGSSKWQAAWQIVLPAALPGVFAAGVLGFGRAMGETMIVLMVCSASVMSWSIFDSARSITTTYAYDALNRLTSKTYNDSRFLMNPGFASPRDFVETTVMGLDELLREDAVAYP